MTIGFAFGNLQAELIPFSGAGTLGAVPAYAALAGVNEVAPNVGDPDGAGSAAVSLNAQTGEVCYALTVSNIAPATPHRAWKRPAAAPPISRSRP